MTGEARTVVTRVHEGEGAGQASRPGEWATAITATTDTQVFVRGVALDEAIGRESFPAMLLRLWRGDAATDAEAALMGACMVAAIDHGPLAPSALVARTVASTRAGRMSALAGGILSFGDLHGAVVTRAMQIVATVPAEGDLEAWADGVFETERAAGRRLPGIGHRWHAHDLRAERLLDVATEHGDGRHAAAVRVLAARVAAHVGRPVAVNIDGALAVALTALRLDPEYGDFLFAIAQELRARRAHRRGTRTRAADAHDRSHCRAVRRRPGSRPACQGDTFMKVRLISPFDDAEQIWIGLDEPGKRRKVFRFVSPATGSEEFMAGITIFEPGEASSYHIHPESEEINLVLAGSGVVVSEGEEAAFDPGQAMWVPKGVYHQHRNTGSEPLRLLWVYTPQAELPSD